MFINKDTEIKQEEIMQTQTVKNDKKSMLIFISSMLIFGTIGIFRRFIPLPSAVLACFRGFSGALLLILIVKLQRKKLRHNIGVKNVLGLVFVGVLIGFNWIFLFEAYNYTTVATATLCYYMEPTIVVLLSPMFLREKLTAKKGICALIAIIGMILVSGIAENGVPKISEMKGVLYGLCAAMLYSAVVIMNKKLPGIDAYEKTVIQLISASAVLLPYIIAFEDLSALEFDLRSVIMLLIVGFVHTGIAYAMYFGSMDGLQAQSIAIFSYLDPISALILSALILNEKMSLFGVIGAILIIGAALISELSFKGRKVNFRQKVKG